MAHTGEAPVLILPGFNGSGPDHWQSEWERANPLFRRVEQRDWDNPTLSDWLGELHCEVAACDAPPVLVAHSLACALVAHFSRAVGGPHAGGSPAAGALLVAPADVDSLAGFYDELASFSPMPLEPLAFPSIVVASTDDLYVSIERAREFAAGWGSEFIELTGAGHINAESNLADWPDGLSMLNSLRTPGPKRGR